MPASVNLKPWEIPKWFDTGGAPEQYRYRFLVEGDSWMDRSAVLQGSLPDFLGYLLDKRHKSSMFINLAMFGDELRRMGDAVAGDFSHWVQDWSYDAVLLSGGGNDFIDAARDPDPGQGILLDLRGQPAPATGLECINQVAVDKLVKDYLDPNFRLLYDAMRQGKSRGDKPTIPIFLNQYDVPKARNAPALAGSKAWLFEAYMKNGTPPALWDEVTKEIFSALGKALDGWTQAPFVDVHVVPTLGTLIPASDTADNDWVNEIHPNPSGWKKLAAVWWATMASSL